jgi:type IV pilus assembly protein PilB
MLAGVVDISKSRFESYKETLKSVASLKKTIDSIKEQNMRKASAAFEIILAGALKLEASDIHIEPWETSAKIRLRLDGVLQDLSNIPPKLYQLLLSRVKLISEVKLNIHERPQDGRFTIKTDEENVEVRASFLPGPYGESIVLRLLLPKTISMQIEKLGMQPELYKKMLLEIDKPNGMILNTGPTGSGKTTTLYSFLKKIASTEIKVITIENPIEYHLENITQTQVDSSKGYDFSNGLRSIVRQDPDVILVGEIRDMETAEIAMHAALTGHLVFSTLHTNDAAGTIPRLIDLGVKPNIISPAINVVMAQRLVRTLCEKCKVETEPEEKERSVIEKTIRNLPKDYARELPEKFTIWKPTGCSECNSTGYKGRIAIIEALKIDDTMERLIITSPPEADVKLAAKEQGMLTMFEDGILKLLEGLTSFEELTRVASAE